MGRVVFKEVVSDEEKIGKYSFGCKLFVRDSTETMNALAAAAGVLIS